MVIFFHALHLHELIESKIRVGIDAHFPTKLSLIMLFNRAKVLLERFEAAIMIGA